MFWPYSDFFDALTTGNAKVEAELRLRLFERDQLVQDLRNEIAQLRGKIDRMELILMPMSSAAGAAYTRSIHPPSDRAPIKSNPPDETLGWNAYLAKYMKEIDDLEHQTKELQNGISS